MIEIIINYNDIERTYTTSPRCSIPTPMRREINCLARSECANYSKEYGCLPADRPCTAATSTGICKYFRECVLPLDKVLEARVNDIVSSGNTVTKNCAVCGAAFMPQHNRQVYCTEKCAHEGRKLNKRSWMRESRG